MTVVPGYEFLGRVADDAGTSVGTCFQVDPGLLVTAYHVLTAAGWTDDGDVVRIGPIAGGWLTEAVVQRVDALHDLAVLRAHRPLAESRRTIAASDSVRAEEIVFTAGCARPDDDGHEYGLLSATGRWQGPVVRNDLLLASIASRAVMPGMSGAPVLRAADGAVAGVISGRYQSSDGWMRDSVWVSRSEDLASLIGVAPERPALRDRLLPPIPPHLVGLGMVSVLLAAVAATLGLSYGLAPAVVLSPVLVSLLLCLGGLVSRWLDDRSRTGFLLAALGTAAMLSTLNSGLALPPDTPGRDLTVLAGVPAFWMQAPLAIWIFLGFPGGTLPGAADRRLVGVAFAVGGVAGFVLLITKTDVPVCAGWCGRSPVSLVHDADLYLTIRGGFLIVSAALGAAAFVLMARRVRRPTPFLVLAALVLALYGAGTMGLVALYHGSVGSTASMDRLNLILGWVIGPALPLAFLASLARRHIEQYRRLRLLHGTAGVSLTAR